MNGLVLEGGGARGAYHIGALKAFKKRNIKFDYVVGTSIGSINGAFVAANQVNTLEKIWRGVSSKELLGIDDNLIVAIKNREFTLENIKKGLQTVHSILKNAGIDISALEKILTENLDEDKFRESDIEYGLATYNISKAKRVKVFKKDIPKGKLVEYLLASSYLPVFRLRKIIDESFYMDGGIYDKCPLDMLADKNIDTIYIVRVYRGNLLNYDAIANIKEIKPRKFLGSIVAFDRKTIDYNIKLGYYDTLRVIDKLDGNNYYFKRKKKGYYTKIFKDEKLLKKYNRKIIMNPKNIIIDTLERICDDYKINNFKVYNLTTLIIRIKLLNLFKKSKYSDFIRELKVKL